MKCTYCNQDIQPEVNGWDQGHNGWPLTEGRVCSTCNDIVITERIKQQGKTVGLKEKNPKN